MGIVPVTTHRKARQQLNASHEKRRVVKEKCARPLAQEGQKISMRNNKNPTVRHTINKIVAKGTLL